MKFENLTLAGIAKICGNEDTAREWLEAVLWPEGPVCPHCCATRHYKLTARKEGSKTRKGLYKCAECRKQYTVTVNTIFADSHIPISKWLLAISMLCSAKKAVSAHQLHRHLGIAYKSAWFMAHRLREAMASDVFKGALQGVVEMDETYVGGKLPRGHGKVGRPGKDSHKTPVVSIVERGGNKRSMVMRITPGNLLAAVKENVKGGTTVVTDSYPLYHTVKTGDVTHHTVNHKAHEYTRQEGDLLVHTNTVESSFSLLKRGIVGAFHHISRKHLPRYLAEFDFRWNHRKAKDGDRTAENLRKAKGKRLTYAQLTGE